MWSSSGRSERLLKHWVQFMWQWHTWSWVCVCDTSSSQAQVQSFPPLHRVKPDVISSRVLLPSTCVFTLRLFPEWVGVYTTDHSLEWLALESPGDKTVMSGILAPESRPSLWYTQVPHQQGGSLSQKVLFNLSFFGGYAKRPWDWSLEERGWLMVELGWWTSWWPGGICDCPLHDKGRRYWLAGTLLLLLRGCEGRVMAGALSSTTRPLWSPLQTSCLPSNPTLTGMEPVTPLRASYSGLKSHPGHAHSAMTDSYDRRLSFDYHTGAHQKQRSWLDTHGHVERDA